MASAIITQYTVNGLAGANQAVSAAINGLNSNTNRLFRPNTGGILQNADVNNVVETGNWFITNVANVTNLPSGLSGWYLLAVNRTYHDSNGDVLVQELHTVGNVRETYMRAKSGTDWSNWVRLPTRAEVDALNNNIGSPNTAGFRNSTYRGNNITGYLTDGSLWDRIKGTNGYALFDDLFLGDYITIGSNSYAIVDFDYYLRTGSTDVTEHHIVMMPVGVMNIPAGTVLYGSSDTLTLLNGSDVTSKETATAFKWNATAEAPNANSTNGGYKFSRMRTIIMKAADTIVVNAFGASHVKPITVLYYNPSDASASGLASGWTWFDKDDWSDPLRKSICDLPNETQIFGQQVWGRGSAYTNVAFEIGVDKFQFALCGLQKNFVNNRAAYWLRSVASAGYAARVFSDGPASAYGSAIAIGVRPRFLLVG